MKRLYTFYRIFDDNENYIGVTNQDIRSRISRHKYRAYTEMQQSKLYKHVRASTLMYQIIDQEVLSEDDARLKEMLYIKVLKPSLNTVYGS